MAKIDIITLDDWEGVYLDGKLIDQGHSLDLREVLTTLGFHVESQYVIGEELDEFGNSFPTSLEEFKTYLKSKC
jgi:hypothetical protein